MSGIERRAAGGDAAVVALPGGPASAAEARTFVVDALGEWGLEELADDAALCTSELVADAVVRAATGMRLTVRRRGQGVRVEVAAGGASPVTGDAMAGPGLLLVGCLADTWGVDASATGTTAWFDLGTALPSDAADRQLRPVRLVGVPVRLAAASESNVDDLVREWQVLALDPNGPPPGVPGDLVAGVEALLDRLTGPRDAGYRAVREAAATGRRLIDVAFGVPDRAVADLWRLTALLEQVAQLGDDGALLSMAPSAELTAFRRWYAAEVQRQVAGSPPTPCPFPVAEPDGSPPLPAAEQQLYLAERSAREAAEHAAARLGALQALTAGLAGALGTAEVADVVVQRGVVEVGGRSGSLCLLQPDGQTVAIVHQAGYSTDVTKRWQTFPVSADLPASEAIRTGRPVFLASVKDRDARYPALAGTPVTDDGPTAVVPLNVEDRVLGALAVTFRAGRHLDDEDRTFLTALAGLTAQALDRARLHDAEAAARARFAFLAEAADLLNASLDLDDTLTALADLAVPRLGDWCSVHLLDGGLPRLVATAHTDPDKRAAAEALQRRWPVELGTPGIGTVLLDGRPLLFQVVPPEMLAEVARDEEHLEQLRNIGFGSGMVVALVAGGAVLGALAVANTAGRVVTAQEFNLAQDLAARAGAAIANARLFAERTHVARALQASLLPAVLPERPPLEVAARYRAAGEGLDVGGDFYDAFDAPGGRLVLAIGDVCGKGVEAAALTGAARHTIRAVALGEPSPAAVLRRLNDVLGLDAPGALAADEVAAERRFCTVALASVTLAAGGADVQVAVAGHPHPLLVRATGAVETAGATGDLLGVFADVSVTDVVVHLGPGDALVLYTDGLSERHAGDRFFGEEGVEAALGAAAAAGADAATLAERLQEQALAFVEGEPADDLAVVVVRIAP